MYTYTFGTEKYTSVNICSKHQSLCEVNEMGIPLQVRRIIVKHSFVFAAFIAILIKIRWGNIPASVRPPDYGPTFNPTLNAVSHPLSHSVTLPHSTAERMLLHTLR